MTTEYRIVEAGGISALSDAVRKALKEGWRLEGGVAVKWYPKYHGPLNEIEVPSWNYLQAMTKEQPYG